MKDVEGVIPNATMAKLKAHGGCRMKDVEGVIWWRKRMGRLARETRPAVAKNATVAAKGLQITS